MPIRPVVFNLFQNEFFIKYNELNIDLKSFNVDNQNVSLKYELNNLTEKIFNNDKISFYVIKSEIENNDVDINDFYALNNITVNRWYNIKILSKDNNFIIFSVYDDNNNLVLFNLEDFFSDSRIKIFIKIKIKITNLHTFFIPDGLKEKPLFSSIEDMMKYTLSSYSDYDKSYEKLFYNTFNRNNDFYALDIEQIKLIFAEKGYEYFWDLSNELINTEQLNVFFKYLVLFHLLKGSKKGLETILYLLNFSAKIISWYDKQPDLPRNTYEILFNLTIDDAERLNRLEGLISSLTKFLDHYIYPKLFAISKDILVKDKIGIDLSCAGASDNIQTEFLFPIVLLSSLVCSSDNIQTEFEFENQIYLHNHLFESFLVSDSIVNYLFTDNFDIKSIYFFVGNHNDPILIDMKINNIVIDTFTITGSFYFSNVLFSILNNDIVTFEINSISIGDTSLVSEIFIGWN